MSKSIPEKILKSNFRCFFCLNPADRIAFYSKHYAYSGKGTLETPTLCCQFCFDSPRIIGQLNPLRGGDEGVRCFLFSEIGKWSKKQIGYFTSSKLHELNHLSSKPMKKLVWSIHYRNQPKKSQDQDFGEEMAR
jgi:hypothetical protein